MSYAAFDTLSEQNWTYFRDFAVPLVKRSGAERLTDSAYVSLLAALCERAQLPPLDTVISEAGSRFAQHINSWIVSFKNGKVTERQVSFSPASVRTHRLTSSIPQSQHLLDSLMICSGLSLQQDLLASVLQAINVLVAVHSTSEDAQQEYQSTPTNSAVLLSAFLKCLASISATRNLSDEAVVRIAEIYHWHRTTLQILSSIVSSRDALPSPLARKVFIACKGQLLSEDSVIRQSVLRLLEHQHQASTIVKEALETEDVPLTPQDARDKNMHLRRLGIALKAVDGVSDDFEVGILYSFAMLKVNFKPLWSEAIDVIGEACKLKSDAQPIVWRILSEQLHMIANQDLREDAQITAPSWAVSSAETSGPPYMAAWRQHDLTCTAYSRLAGKFLDKSNRYAALAKTDSRTLSARDIQVRGPQLSPSFL